MDSTCPWLPRLTSPYEPHHHPVGEAQRQRQEAFAELRQQTTYYNTWFVEHMKTIDAQPSRTDIHDESTPHTTVGTGPNGQRSESLTRKNSLPPSDEGDETEIIMHGTSAPLPSAIPSATNSSPSPTLALNHTGIDEALDTMITTMASGWTVKDYSLVQASSASEQNANGDDLSWVGDMW
ncbi:hypothetical protein H4R34_002600 [Dimargaris verticillata]|uniref:Uncharacterized protein n=1 Tax=Dimargaris verticillata TaxID=2761393 RepID=A0A9W8ECR8_9FUNG|nr:hypothetical protein H4R34_002600 [Dimargaris verticillata]